MDRKSVSWEIAGPGPDIIIHHFLFALLVKCGTPVPSYRFTLCHFSYLVNCGPQKYYMENSRNKQLKNYNMYAILNGMTESHSVLS